jgi:hypothetical protein
MLRINYQISIKDFEQQQFDMAVPAKQELPKR